MKKKNILSVFATFLFFCISCKNSSTASYNVKENSLAQKNLDAWHVVRMAFANGTPNAIDTVIADDYIDHKSSGDVVGRDSVKANITRTHSNFKDLKMELIKELADNDFGFFWMHFAGSSIGTPTVPAGSSDMHTIEVVKFQNGKAAEHWQYRDINEMMKMMEAGRNNNNKMAQDTTRIKMNKAE